MPILVTFVKSMGTEGEGKATQVMRDLNKTLASCAVHPRVELPTPEVLQAASLPGRIGRTRGEQHHSAQPGQWQFLAIKFRLS